MGGIAFLLIDNGDDNVKSIELDWLANTRQVFNSERFIERRIIDNKILIPFLKENLNYDSKVTIRYMGEEPHKIGGSLFLYLISVKWLYLLNKNYTIV